MIHGQLPLISVIVAPRSNPSGLYDVLRPVLSSDYFNLQVVAIRRQGDIFDGRINDERVTSIEVDKVASRASILNFGIIQSKGDFVTFIDDDCVWVDSKIAERSNTLVEMPGANVVFSPVIYHTDSTTILMPDDKEIPRLGNGGNIDNISLLGLTQNVIPFGSVLVRRSLFHLVGLFETSHLGAFEHEMWIRAARLGPLVLFRAPMAMRYDGDAERATTALRPKSLDKEYFA